MEVGILIAERTKPNNTFSFETLYNYSSGKKDSLDLEGRVRTAKVR